MQQNLSILRADYFELYCVKQRYTLEKHVKKLKTTALNFDDFKFYLTSAAVYSSQIEGNLIDLDSYMKYCDSGMNTKGKSFQEIANLIDAYDFATKNEIAMQNILNVHKLLSASFLDENFRGIIRTKEVGVFAEGKKIYTAATVPEVTVELEKLVSDIVFLIKQTLTVDEIFYYAAQIHLRFAQIHPFADGNGRTARLLEKWFLSAFFHEKAFAIASEKHYFKQRKSYYFNIHLGNSYNDLDYTHCIPFLLMLPMALREK